ncbi:AraC family transcriptional regulator [Companilactobacillus allii]|uniref:AraC family transcriptional regulator n=1 Tax=Companilactobacillus allii TaxID=1847728 RepID=A0A1P8Q0K6_9LACO|nr:AraC family transcriptional regulator [Companilactobacillus allii]APX71400.1 AraC family transcriptional regulator [Companilactobacillus allii]USQ68480.1 AraC family transcriptional regulator [Companilactobacillus allii]
MNFKTITDYFHDATNLSIFIFNIQNKDIYLSKTPITPMLPNNLKIKLLNNINKEITISIFSNIGAIATFQLNNTKFIIWATSNAITGNGKYDDKIPLIDFNTFKSQLTLFYISLTQDTPTFSSNQLDLIDYDIIDRPNQQIESFNEHKPSHNGYLAEQKMLLGVEHGNLNEFNDNYVNFMNKGNFGVLSPDDLRSKKNITVAATTLFTRAAIRGGMFAEDAYNLSDECIKKTESIRNITNIYEYTRTIGERFVKNVAQIKRQNIPSIIYRAQEYIYDNLSTVEDVGEIAQSVGCSKSYLMHLFKDTTGISVIEFLTAQKILSAKQLLIFTQLPINEIATLMGYKNQSQLSRTFKKMTGVSPINFRKSQHI